MLSHVEVAALHALRKHAPAAGDEPIAVAGNALTIDIGMRVPKVVRASANGVELVVSRGDGDDVLSLVPWKFLAKSTKKNRVGAWTCWRTGDGDDEPPSLITGISDVTQRTASLLPLDEERGPPTVVLGGFSMHRMKQVSPKEDTERKLAALGRRLRGDVLDICTGLGYTAVGAAAKEVVVNVVTIELDPLMVEMQRSNPWSAELFEDSPSADSAKITRLLGDATDILPDFSEGSFDCCIHDPPANAMSGELYSAEFYRSIHRCLRPNGALFHYIGDPSSKASGRLFKGIAERLREAGFEDVKTVAKAYGIAAVARGNGR